MKVGEVRIWNVRDVPSSSTTRPTSITFCKYPDVKWSFVPMTQNFPFWVPRGKRECELKEKRHLYLTLTISLCLCRGASRTQGERKQRYTDPPIQLELVERGRSVGVHFV